MIMKGHEDKISTYSKIYSNGTRTAEFPDKSSFFYDAKAKQCPPPSVPKYRLFDYAVTLF